ncbi:hypothetical protein DFH08DRAFT_952747 [Mycena albidolilacea]|uniref:RRM domain-containing protein n=1 Tax=Mycena albidolilacea TaxID=1033008 RepID=A0AAD7EYT2_9AGAR|nr:hypothetical protein DFH08DRAFT_952747 [Mycena albidolilacea]
MTHTTPSSLSGPVFKFSSQTNAVCVENIPQNMNRLEVLALFSTLIGDIRASQDSGDALEITFFSADSARKALCMTGYNIAGSALLVTPVVRTASPVSAHGSQQGKRSDTRRNLYVLGTLLFFFSLYTVYSSPIPARSVSDQNVLCSQSLAAVFSPHGAVSHCVILATLDSASRRRGFVVMSTHEQARQAMAALGRNSKGAGGMDISWAVVQRSKGFLDGGDRAGIVHPPTASLSPPPPPVLETQVPSNDTQGLPRLSAAPTSTILLVNLPSLLFGTEDDLRGLVCPFGTVKSLRMVHLPASSSTAPAPRITAAIAHYTSLAAAQDAHRALEGESYAGCMVRVAYLVEPKPEPASAPESPLPETPTFPAQLNFPPSRSSSSFATAPRCGPLVHKPMFDGRNVGNQVFGGVGYGYASAGRQWRGPELVQQQQFYAAPPFPRFESYSAYGVNELPGRWIPDSMYVRAPSTRDMGYYV